MSPWYSERRQRPIETTQQGTEETPEGRHYTRDGGVDIRPGSEVALAQPPVLAPIVRWR